jgi:hypothetical protein
MWEEWARSEAPRTDSVAEYCLLKPLVIPMLEDLFLRQPSDHPYVPLQRAVHRIADNLPRARAGDSVSRANNPMPERPVILQNERQDMAPGKMDRFPVNWEMVTQQRLKYVLARRGLTTSGNKPVQVGRLRGSDRSELYKRFRPLKESEIHDRRLLQPSLDERPVIEYKNLSLTNMALCTLCPADSHLTQDLLRTVHVNVRMFMLCPPPAPIQ